MSTGTPIPAQLTCRRRCRFGQSTGAWVMPKTAAVRGSGGSAVLRACGEMRSSWSVVATALLALYASSWSIHAAGLLFVPVPLVGYLRYDVVLHCVALETLLLAGLFRLRWWLVPLTILFGAAASGGSILALYRHRRRHVHCAGVGVLVLKMTALPRRSF